eukprot:1209629-Rhodomonas_salina.1
MLSQSKPSPAYPALQLQPNEPKLLLQAALPSQSCVSRRHSSKSEHVTRSVCSSNPIKHSHTNDPIVLLQKAVPLALSTQLWVPLTHSFVSVQLTNPSPSYPSTHGHA